MTWRESGHGVAQTFHLAGIRERRRLRFVPMKTHGVVDYLLSALLLVGSWWLDLGGTSTLMLFVAGFVVLALNLFTNYELGLLPRLTPRTHLRLDVLLGSVVALTPLVFSGAAWVPQLLVGALLVLLALITIPRPHTRTPAPANTVGEPKANDVVDSRAGVGAPRNGSRKE